MTDLFHGRGMGRAVNVQGRGIGRTITRRGLFGGAGAALTLARIPRARAGVQFPQRLLIVNMLGGLDGLSAVVPYGDANLAGLRAPLVPPGVGQKGGMFDLGGYYGLNPNLPNLYALFQAGQLLPVHAVGNVEYTRSHFQGQGLLQSGVAGTSTSGWMDRLVGLMPNTGGGIEPGLVIGAGLPTIAQGPTGVASWAHDPFTSTSNALAALVETLGQSDPLVGGPIQSGFNDETSFRSWLKGHNVGGSPFVSMMNAAGLFLSAPQGAAVAVMQTSVMDTHNNQVSRLAPLLSDFDNGVAAFANACGASWSDTVLLTITEFGRTAAMNGSGGTDHGTGFAMFLAGGPVVGNRVLPSPSDWPGLGAAQLYQNRDLDPVYDVRSVVMGVLQDHMGLSQTQLATVFPNAGVSPLGGLVSS